ncbi:MAG: hypothetical protein WB609_00175 [Candidatus Cybelea sp.]
MPLQTGDWKINLNGSVGVLNIASVNFSSGNVAGSFGGQPIGGFWDEITQRLTFSTGSVQTGLRAFFGFLTPDQHRMPGVTGDGVVTLVGYYTEVPSQAEVQRFGWYAQLGTT